MKILFMLLPVVYLAGNGYLFVRVGRNLYSSAETLPAVCLSASGPIVTWLS